MIFTSFEYLFFLSAVLFLRSLCRSFALEKMLLLIASYAFYASWNPPWVILLFAVSIVDYNVGRLMGKTEAPAKRKLLLAASLSLNLGLLAYFKYANFFIENVHALLTHLGWHFARPTLHVTLPLGISFFTFQSISYVFDVYRRHLEPCTRFRDFMLFVAFFPQLIAGPIVRAIYYLPQLLTRRRATPAEIESGIALFLLGVIKKAVISDQISGHVAAIFAAPGKYDAPTLLMGVLGYAAQIYCDFSGYSDMAIGTARILGYHFLENFRMPYLAGNIAEFWRRWHISLSTWLRDYLYIPLGGNRHGTARTYRNLAITMLLGGLWHGASWNFIIWGAIHGAALCIHRLFSEGRQPPSSEGSRLRGFAGWLATMVVVLVGWVFFRATTLGESWDFLRRIATWRVDGIHMLSPRIAAALASIALVHILFRKNPAWLESHYTKPAWMRILLYSTMFTIIVTLGATDASPFIYFQF